MYIRRVLLFPVWALLFTALSIHAQPTSNPAPYDAATWTADLPWDNVIDIQEVEGSSWDEKVKEACTRLSQNGGGVLYFPAGDYSFEEDIVLPDGVILRGADPEGKAKDEHYNPPTQFHFPKYKPSFEGSGTPNDTAFKRILLQNPESDSHCGIVNIGLHYASIYFPGGKQQQAGKNRIVHGCWLRACARPIPSVPQSWQHSWQRFTHRHRGAIMVYVSKNALVSNNRLANSQEENFTMSDYLMKKDDKIISFDKIVFDYDNRPGIVVNGYAIGGAGASGNDGTPETHPHGFRQGVRILDNRIFSTGGYAILFTGDGTICAGNEIQFKEEVKRYTVTGEVPAKGSSTNGNRAVEMRGWNYLVKDNHYEVYSNRAGDSGYYINDGEGLMHEDHVNSLINDSRIIGNVGNTYISIYKTGGIDGLIIKENEIESQIYVVANRNRGDYFCNNVLIENNKTPVIRIEGNPAKNNVIKDNVSPATQGEIINKAKAKLINNKGYDVN